MAMAKRKRIVDILERKLGYEVNGEHSYHRKILRGFIGTNLTNELRSRGHDVWTL